MTTSNKQKLKDIRDIIKSVRNSIEGYAIRVARYQKHEKCVIPVLCAVGDSFALEVQEHRDTIEELETVLFNLENNNNDILWEIEDLHKKASKVSIELIEDIQFFELFIIDANIKLTHDPFKTTLDTILIFILGGLFFFAGMVFSQ